MRFYGEILWELQGLSIYSNLNWMEQSENDWCQIKKKAGFKEKGRILKIETGLLVLGI